MSLTSSVYQGNHCLPANKKTACSLSRKRKLTKEILESKNARVRESVNFQKSIALGVLQRMQS